MYTKKFHIDANNHLLSSNCCFSYVFVRDATGIGRIAIGRKEVIRRIEMQLFRIHHFVVAEISIYLIACAFWCCLTGFSVKKTQNYAANWVSSYWCQNKVMYMKWLQKHANNHLPFSDLPYDQYALRGGRQRGKNRHVSYVIARNTTGIGRIQNQTTEGGSSRRRASFFYTSHLRGIKIHILNCCRSLKKFGGVCQGIAANRRGSNRGQHYSQWKEEG